MQRLLIVILSTFAAISSAICQQISLEDIPTKEIEKRAKEATKKSVDSLATILELTKKETKIRQFKLDFCEFYTDVPQGETSLTPAGEFPVILGCPGKYYYIYQSNFNTGHYLITFFYNKNGDIVAKEIMFEWAFK